MRGYIIGIPPNGQVSFEEAAAPEDILEPLRRIVQGSIETIPHFDTLYLPREVILDNRHLVDFFQGEDVVECSAFCNESGKGLGLPMNEFATSLWALALHRKGIIERHGDGTFSMPDICVGPVAVVIGDKDFLEQM